MGQFVLKLPFILPIVFGVLGLPKGFRFFSSSSLFRRTFSFLLIGMSLLLIIIHFHGGEFEGIYFKDPYKLYLKLKHKIRRIERGGCEEDIQYYLLDKTMPYVDSEGNFTGVIDNDKYNNLDKYRKQRADEFYKRLVNFVESENINDLFPHSI